jgi:hypothetical protein
VAAGCTLRHGRDSGLHECNEQCRGVGAQLAGRFMGAGQALELRANKRGTQKHFFWRQIRQLGRDDASHDLKV